MRGQRTLFTNLLIVDEIVPDEPRKRGRSADQCAARNEALAARFYYYLLVAVGKLSAYEAIIDTLSGEFWLEPYTVVDLLQKNSGQIATLKREKPARQYFVSKWPHLVWPPAKA